MNGIHFVQNVRSISSTDPSGTIAYCELDSHVNTCCAGSNTLLIVQSECRVSVCPYTDTYMPIKDVPITTVVTLWEDQMSGHALVLITHKMLFLGEKLQGSLLNPNQLQAHGVHVKDIPHQFDKSLRHSIYILEAGV